MNTEQREILPGLSDQQIEAVIRVARPLDPEKRGTFLVRLMAHLRDAPPDLHDIQFEALLWRAMQGLLQQAPAA